MVVMVVVVVLVMVMAVVMVIVMVMVEMPEHTISQHICCASHEICTSRSDFGPPNTRFPLRLPRKVITKPENVHGTTTRAQPRRALAPGPPDSASLRSRNAL